MKRKGLTIRQQRIEKAVSTILEAIGEDPQREGLQDTPRRVASMYLELFSGIGLDPAAAIDTVFAEDYHDPIVLRDVPFYSICEHHLLPFFGLAHLAYIPNGKIAGISKLTRALDVISRRPQLQERLTRQAADTLVTALDPKGVVVEVEAEHLCMAMRGVKIAGSRIITTATRGRFENCDMNQEALLALLRNR